MKMLHMIAFVLVIVGGLNWLLVGLLGQDIGGYILGGMDSTVSKIVYILVGLSAIVLIVTHKKDCKACSTSSSMPSDRSSMNQGM